MLVGWLCEVVILSSLLKFRNYCTSSRDLFAFEYITSVLSCSLFCFHTMYIYICFIETLVSLCLMWFVWVVYTHLIIELKLEQAQP